jgi:hypothetical protein
MTPVIIGLLVSIGTSLIGFGVIIFRGGRWSGKIEERLASIEEDIKELKGNEEAPAPVRRLRRAQ